jgi:hypothetical protein
VPSVKLVPGFGTGVSLTYGPPDWDARYTLYPTTLLDVLAFQARVTLCCGAGVPVPVKASIVEELEASLANVMFAEAVLYASGAKVTGNEAVCPAAIVSGNTTPVTANRELSAPAEETVTAASVALRSANRNRLECLERGEPAFEAAGSGPDRSSYRYEARADRNAQCRYILYTVHITTRDFSSQ